MAKNTLRSGQMVTTFGPGSLLDLPNHAVILSSLDHWKYDWNEIPVVNEPRLLASLTRQLPDNPPKSFRLPPPALEDNAHGFSPSVTAWEFPDWFVVQKSDALPNGGKRRQIVHRTQLDGRRFRDNTGKSIPVVPIRFVRACNKGHIDDIDWRTFIHSTNEHHCTRPIWMEERGTSGTMADTWVVCDCGEERSMSHAAREKTHALGFCTGRRPWLGPASNERCGEHSKLLVRSASNAYFPQTVSAISIPSNFGIIDNKVATLWEKGLNFTQTGITLTQIRQMNPTIGNALNDHPDTEVEAAIQRYLDDTNGADDRPLKEVEFDALSQVLEESGADVPNGDFYARSMPIDKWQTDAPWMSPIKNIVLVHRLREVITQIGFTRFESISPQLDGELDLDVESAPLSRKEEWLPATENRGEGIFIEFDQEAITSWANLSAVLKRTQMLASGFQAKFGDNEKKKFFGAPFYMIHSFSHLLMNRIALECGYPASSIRERVYALKDGFGLLIYTGSSDAQGTLGGLVGVSKNISDLIRRALIGAELCSNDPVCAHDEPNSENQRELLGSACHGCQLVAETSCEWCNCFLDRELVVRTIHNSGAEFFKDYEF